MSRATAFEVLRSGSPAPMREVNRFAERYELDSRDRGLARAIVGTEVRRRATLRAIVSVFAKGNPSPEVATILRIGVAQLLFLDSVPDHAAISESVRVATNYVSLARGGYVNGVLRSIQRARAEGHCGERRQDLIGADWHFRLPVFRDPEEHPLLWAEDAYSLPSNLLKRWVKRMGQEKALALAAQALTETDVSVAILRGERAEWLAETETLKSRPGKHPKIALVESAAIPAIIQSAAFTEGRITIQGETAVRAAEAVQAQPGERVLDLCAAPGGKTAQLAATGAKVTALDISERRLLALQETLGRLQFSESVVALESDGTAGLEPDQEPFDAALLDAPCSNTGVLAARPNARWRFGPQSQKELTVLQARLLDEASTWVRPGGRLVYSTCSLESDENTQQVKRFLESHTDWNLEHDELAFPEPVGSAGPIDGGYHARLRRKP